MSTSLSTTGSKKLKTVCRQFSEKFPALEIEFFEKDTQGQDVLLDPDSKLSEVRKMTGDGSISIHGRKLGINFLEEIRKDVGLSCRMFWVGADGKERHLLKGDWLYRGMSKLSGIESMVPPVRVDASWVVNEDSAMVVAGRFAEEIAGKHHFYFCQNDRAFRPSKYIAFYNEGRIERVHEILGQPFDDALAENTGELKDITKAHPEHAAAGGALEPGLRKRCMRLGPAMKVGPIVNDKVGKHGKSVPFTYGQARYTTLELLKGAKKTSELIHGLENRVEDRFRHTRQEIPGKVDVLWVIDNSGSMGSHQTMLVSESEKFMDQLLRVAPDKRPRFQMHRTTTDGDWDTLWIDSCHNEAADPKFWFKYSIEDCGTSGSADEEGLRCAYSAVTGHSSLRQAESLLVVVVTDEDDSSDESVLHYVNGMKERVQGNLTIVSIGGGARYAEAASLTGGRQHALGSAGFSALLKHIKTYVEETSSSYVLKAKVADAGSIRVEVDGKPYSGFMYHPTSNSVEVGKDVQSNASISVNYEAAE